MPFFDLSPCIRRIAETIDEVRIRMIVKEKKNEEFKREILK